MNDKWSSNYKNVFLLFKFNFSPFLYIFFSLFLSKTWISYDYNFEFIIIIFTFNKNDYISKRDFKNVVKCGFEWVFKIFLFFFLKNNNNMMNAVIFWRSCSFAVVLFNHFFIIFINKNRNPKKSQTKKGILLKSAN